MRAYKFSIKKTIDYIIMSDLDSMQTDTQTIVFFIWPSLQSGEYMFWKLCSM